MLCRRYCRWLGISHPSTEIWAFWAVSLFYLMFYLVLWDTMQYIPDVFMPWLMCGWCPVDGTAIDWILVVHQPRYGPSWLYHYFAWYMLIQINTSYINTSFNPLRILLMCALCFFYIYLYTMYSCTHDESENDLIKEYNIRILSTMIAIII